MGDQQRRQGSPISQMMVLIDEASLRERIAELAAQMDADLLARDAVLVVALKGGFLFAADLVKAMASPPPVVFAAPRADGGLTCLSPSDRLLIKGRTVVVVDALLDQGGSLRRLTAQLQELEPAEVRYAVLLHKTVWQAGVDPLPVHYLGFEVPNVRLVGYGLDEGQEFRGMPAIYAWRRDSPYANR